MDPEIENLKRRVYGPKPDLVINRVPKIALDNFKSMANEQFNGDYGFALKFLMDGFGDAKFEFILTMMQDYEDRLAKLEHNPTPRKIRLCGGRVLELKKKEE